MASSSLEHPASPWKDRSMILVRTGGIVGLAVSLVVAAAVVRPAIERTTERAFDAASEIRAAAGADDYLSAASFAAVVAQIKAEVGARGELLGLTVSKHGGGNVKYRSGDRAAGFRWGPRGKGLEPVKVTLVGPGKLADNVFPIAKLKPGATAALTAAVKAEQGAGFEPQTMSLGIDPATGAVRWTVTGEGGGRARVFTARGDASHLERIA
jgi:hypothetical protein